MLYVRPFRTIEITIPDSYRMLPDPTFLDVHLGIANHHFCRSHSHQMSFKINLINDELNKINATK